MDKAMMRWTTKTSAKDQDYNMINKLDEYNSMTVKHYNTKDEL